LPSFFLGSYRFSFLLQFSPFRSGTLYFETLHIDKMWRFTDEQSALIVKF